MELLNKPKEPVVVVPVDPNPPIQRRGSRYIQGSDRMKEREMQNVVKSVNNPEINAHVKKARFARGMQNVGFVAIPALAFTIGYSVYAVINNLNNGGGAAYNVDYTPAIATGIVGVAAFATSITFSIVRKNHNNAAVKIYNEKY
ncbi:MAG: hypothetical protein H0W84_05115 [Bacteroidetes bacterium]|nr:hypothetical protein [Bacteroidota bacterium]